MNIICLFHSVTFGVMIDVPLRDTTPSESQGIWNIRKPFMDFRTTFSASWITQNATSSEFVKKPKPNPDTTASDLNQIRTPPSQIPPLLDVSDTWDHITNNIPKWTHFMYNDIRISFIRGAKTGTKFAGSDSACGDREGRTRIKHGEVPPPSS